VRDLCGKLQTTVRRVVSQSAVSQRHGGGGLARRTTYTNQIQGNAARQMPHGGKEPTQCRKTKASGVFLTPRGQRRGREPIRLERQDRDLVKRGERGAGHQPSSVVLRAFTWTWQPRETEVSGGKQADRCRRATLNGSIGTERSMCWLGRQLCADGEPANKQTPEGAS
jgi:hypothetical protein